MPGVVRALLLVLAAAAVAVAILRAGEDRDCRAAQRDAFAIGLRSPAGRALEPGAVARRVEAGCTGGAALAAASTGLLRGGGVDAAALLAREATARDPDDHRSWRAFAAVLAERGNLAGARAARARAAELSPERPAPG